MKRGNPNLEKMQRKQHQSDLKRISAEAKILGMTPQQYIEMAIRVHTINENQKEKGGE